MNLNGIMSIKKYKGHRAFFDTGVAGSDMNSAPVQTGLDLPDSFAFQSDEKSPEVTVTWYLISHWPWSI
jgi:hypothetical protein